MTPYSKIVSGPLVGVLLLALSLPSTGCDAFEPTMFPVGDTVVLHSLARAEHIGEVSAFDFIIPQAVVVERPKDRSYTDFDVAISELDGAFVMLPAGMFETFDIEPGIVVDRSGVVFEEVTEAPSSGYITDTEVPLELGPIYVVRTRAQNACSRYAKFEVLDLDMADGTVEFRFLRNNLCNDRALIADDLD